jgi:HEAT repeat protein
MRFPSKKGVIAVRWRNGVALCGVAAALVALLPTTVAYGQAQPKAGPQAPLLDHDELKKDLASKQEGRVLGALSRVQAAATQAKPLAPDVEALLAKGSTIKVTLSALRALSALASESSSAFVAPYVQHRLPKVRRTAATTLLKTKGPVAVSALRAALRSPDARVRAIAARGLGDLDASSALDDLFKALDHRVDEAAVSIGKLCDVPACMKFVGRLGALQLGVITSGTDEILFRPAEQVDDKTKMAVIERLASLRTRSGTEYLADVYRRWPKTASPMVKEALKDAVEDNGGDLGEDQK